MSSAGPDEEYPFERLLATIKRKKSPKEFEFDLDTCLLSMKGKDPQVFKLGSTIPKKFIMWFGVKYGIDRHEFWKRS